MTGAEVLQLPMGENDADAATIKEYLIKLLEKLWADGECFGGKRPFGNSGWEFELYLPLLTAGAVPGTLDSEGYIQEIDSDKAAVLIFDAIKAL